MASVFWLEASLQIRQALMNSYCAFCVIHFCTAPDNKNSVTARLLFSSIGLNTSLVRRGLQISQAYWR